MPSTRAIKVAEKPRRDAAESSYERDFYAWSFAQARALRTRRPEELDWENLAEEIESLGKSDRRQVRSGLKVILVHLLKWRYQTKRRSNSWKTTINSQRYELEMVLAVSPSLRRQIPGLMVEAYVSARLDAKDEMGMSASEAQSLPEACPFTSQQVLDRTFLPEEAQ
jgi:hypothetical protein